MFSCVIVVVAFIYFSIDTKNVLAKIFYFEIVVAIIFVGFYLYKHSHKDLMKKDDSKEQYILILNNEIKLLSSAKYWYVLPPFVGLLGLATRDVILDLQKGEDPIMSILYLMSCILLAIGLIYLNEVKCVRALKEELERALQ